MFDTVKNLPSQFFTRPNYDFFGPEAKEENLQCLILTESTTDHLLLNCNEGIGRAKVIHRMAQQIVNSCIAPSWLRHNGSVNLAELRKTVRMTDEVADKLLTSDGFVKLNDLHFFDRESLNHWSQEQGKQSTFINCPSCRNEYTDVTFSPAIALRVKMGKNFNPKACAEVFRDSPKTVTLSSNYSVLEIPKPERYLTAIDKTTVAKYDSWFWSRAVAVAALSIVSLGLSYYSGHVPSFHMLVNQGF